MATGGGWAHTGLRGTLHSTGRMIYLRAAPETVLGQNGRRQGEKAASGRLGPGGGSLGR